jgi:hypothetical protein
MPGTRPGIRHKAGHDESIFRGYQSPSRSRDANVLQGEVVPGPVLSLFGPVIAAASGKNKTTKLAAISSFIPTS